MTYFIILPAITVANIVKGMLLNCVSITTTKPSEPINEKGIIAPQSVFTINPNLLSLLQ